MTDDFDNSNDDSNDKARRGALIARIRTEGAEAAFEAAYSLCRDPKAPANARASAINSIFRASGFFDSSGDDDGEKDLASMSPDEIDAELKKAKAALARSVSKQRPPKGGLFD